MKTQKQIPWGSIAEVIADVRGGTNRPRTLARKAAWCMTCLLDALEGEDVPNIVFFKSKEDLAEELEEKVIAPVSVVEAPGGETIATAANPPKSLPPEVHAMLLQLMQQLIGEWRRGEV